MPTATVTSKGQITIPADIRKALGLKTGTRIDFFRNEEGMYVLRPKTRSIMELRGCVAYSGPTISIEEMNQAVLDYAAERDRATRSDAPENQADGEAA